MFKLKLSICLAAFCLLTFPAYISAEISASNYEIIKIAFTNGYVQGLNANSELVKDLNGNTEKIKRLAENAVSEYMDRVVELNSTSSLTNSSFDNSSKLRLY